MNKYLYNSDIAINQKLLDFIEIGNINEVKLLL